MSNEQLKLKLPNVDWEIVDIGSKALLVKDGTHGTHKRVEKGIPLLSAKNISKSCKVIMDDFDSLVSEEDYRAIHRTYELIPDDLLITVVGTLGRAALVEPDTKFTIQRSVAVVRFDTSEVEPRFALQVTQGEFFQRQLALRSNATAQAGVYLGELSRIEFPKPVQAVQRKIAKILTTVDNQIEKTEALIDKYQAVKQGMMHDLFTRGMDENGQLRPRREDGGLGRWEIKPLKLVADVGSGVTLGRKFGNLQTVSIPYLRVANVQDGYLDLNEIKVVEVLPADVDRYALKTGDLLLTEGGDFDKLGRGALWREEVKGCIHQNHIFKVRPNKDVIMPEFLEAIIGSWYGKKYFILSAKQTTNLASINSTQLKAFPVPCPSLKEQQQIVVALQSISGTLHQEQLLRCKLRAIKTALMQDLLTGKIPVTPDNEKAA